MRLFVAVDLSIEATDKVAELARPEIRNVRWTTPDQWHVTVRFLGEVVEDELKGANGLLGALDTVPALMREERTGLVEAVMGPAVAWFPGRQILQVPIEGLQTLAGAVARATASWGDPPERSFRGHLTLARMRGRDRGPASLAGAPVVARWPVSEVVLYASTTSPEGSRYQAIHQVPLAD